MLTTPLKKISVVEFCHVAAGPFTGMLLADLGADVVKVESPAGDSMRSWPPLSAGVSENFASLNRNKRSVVFDLKTAAGNAAARALIAKSDVLIENNRPGVMARLGLSYEDLRTDNPALVYCSISAFGQSGPRAGDGGFDVTLQAVSGIMSVTGEETGDPVKAGVPIADFATGLYAAFMITSLLSRVAEGRGGGSIDMSMLGACLGVSALQTSEFFGTGKNPRKLGSAHPRNAPYQAFRAKDTHFVLAAGNDKLWASVCDVVERQELANDSRFLSTTDRARNQEQLKVLLEQVFEQSEAAHWIQLLRRKGVPCEPINTFETALDDPQVAHSGWVQDLVLASGIATKTFGFPGFINEESPAIRRRPPALGEHTDEVLEELGLRYPAGSV